MHISRLWNATAATTGTLFVIVFIFGVIASLGPYADIELTSSSAQIAEALVDGTDNLVTGNYVIMMSSFLLVVFAGYLRHAVSPGGVRSWPATVGFGGGLLTAALLAVIALLGMAQGQIESYGADTAVAKALLALSWGSMSMTIPGFAALSFGTSLMSLSYGTLPRWIGWLGMVATVFSLTFWVFGILVTLIWVVIVSVLLVIREARAEEIPEDETADN
ncbi:MAG: hypothetical protein QNJ81_12490 [Acidimicrobiia bacterium]|nr:hypothetical protein [Acidimicrobiia bacterium]